MGVRPAEYGTRGVVGIGVPQANPTVEPEFWALRPAGVTLVTVRLYCADPDSRERLAAYLLQLAHSLAQFDELGLDAFGFACTGSTYLLGHAEERRLVATLEAARGHPIVTAAAAIEETLKRLRARRIILIAPYPDWLGGLGVRYWQDRGFEVLAHPRVAIAGADTRNIYRLRSDDALRALHALPAGVRDRADAVVFSGTGMPSLRALSAARAAGVRAVSSNLCLSLELARVLGLAGEDDGVDLPADLGQMAATL